MLKSIAYALVSSACILAALLAALFMLDERPIEGRPLGVAVVYGCVFVAALLIYFVVHRATFGPRQGLVPGLKGHMFRASVSYLMVLVGMVASVVGIVDGGRFVIITDRSAIETLLSSPVMLALVPVAVDVIRGWRKDGINKTGGNLVEK